ncbi:RidA family protein [Anaerococcus sp. NML200574]|uniref:RidA family protein n=1 Tax=Anaerococcus kampingae TaxID=3115614 RepID=A0ABW9MD62_9FIRM|nr:MULTISPECIES: RidA family protein [unclassified Anaerococcus]MCW6678682.1 RidA family protein [Anaerococcus sp. NML200574]MCW6701042.1 RidA family protein [Anaerococcus sp. NML200537]
MKAINTEKAPAAVGAYVQAIATDNLIFTSGQLPLDPATGELESDIKKATKRALENIKAIVEEAGSSVDKIIKCNVFLDKIEDFAAFNEVYEEFFGDHKPARSALEVANIPKGAVIEIEAIALS